MRLFVSSIFALGLAASATLAACQGCHAPAPNSAVDGDPAAGKPTVRLYLLSTVAGALEPCGCTKDQLGGVDHLAAFLAAEAARAPNRLLLETGPLLYLEPTMKDERAKQNAWKAEAMALSAREMDLAAWTPGLNDWASGNSALASDRERSGAVLLAANLDSKPAPQKTAVREIGGIKVGLVAVADPKDRSGRYPEEVRASSAMDAMRAGLGEVKRQGARVLVGLAALPRGEALRLADAFPELNVLAIGKPVEIGDANDAPKPPVLAGTTLVVETSNHLQTVAVVDLFVERGAKESAPLVFADASGVAKAERLLGVMNRYRELENRINSWTLDPHIKAEDLAARKAELEKLRAERTALEAPEPSPRGSFFRYRLVEIREGLGRDPKVAERLLGYYKRVNEHNKKAFADRKPPEAPKGQAGYIGVERCTECHDEERKVWDATPHANAYVTLEKQFKEYNLDCVSCHVTGYEKPGGSTVTLNESLRGVQCEECHGPGSLHAKEPKKKGLIVTKPAPESCVAACHHPPHVEGFDAAAKTKLVLGPGHGP